MTDTPRNNCFNLIRLLAAFFVIYDHSYLQGHPHHRSFADYGYVDIGGIAVTVFFAISGYLVTQSWLTDPSFHRFLARRFLRIFPALIFVVVLSAFALGPLLTTLSSNDYFHNPETLSYLKNISLFYQQDTLPGVFTANKESQNVNGPLWSLPYEFACYIAVALCGLIRLYRLKIGNLLFVCALFGAYAWYIHKIGFDHINDDVLLVRARHIEAFLIGSLIASGDCRYVPKPLLAVGLAIAVAAAIEYTNMLYIFPALIAVGTVFIGRSFSISIGNNDYSYGFYLWGCIVEQIIVQNHPILDDAPFVILAIALTFVPASLSWHLVERHALRLKPKHRLLNG